ncbi:MAG: hypothetical protein AB2411_17625, partial [Mesobacillus sp.]
NLAEQRRLVSEILYGQPTEYQEEEYHIFRAAEDEPEVILTDDISSANIAKEKTIPTVQEVHAEQGGNEIAQFHEEQQQLVRKMNFTY